MRPILSLALASLALGAPTPAAFSWGKTKYLFSFGDSESVTKASTNLKLKCFSCTGYTKTGWPANSTLSAEPGQTAAGGPSEPGTRRMGSELNCIINLDWIEYLTDTFSQSTLLLRNFAYGRATIDASLVVPYLSTVQSLLDQVILKAGKY